MHLLLTHSGQGGVVITLSNYVCMRSRLEIHKKPCRADQVLFLRMQLILNLTEIQSGNGGKYSEGLIDLILVENNLDTSYQLLPYRVI